MALTVDEAIVRQNLETVFRDAFAPFSDRLDIKVTARIVRLLDKDPQEYKLELYIHKTEHVMVHWTVADLEEFKNKIVELADSSRTIADYVNNPMG